METFSPPLKTIQENSFDRESDCESPYKPITVRFTYEEEDMSVKAKN
jgi:hypothetical protein